MAGLAPVELTADCEACKLEGGVVETYDALVAACRFGLPASTRCKLCGAAGAGVLDRPPAKPLREVPANRCPACLDELTQAAIDERRCARCGAGATVRATAAERSFAMIDELEAALDAWADREGFPSREALAHATFVEPDVARLFAALRAGEPIAVLADPFANMGMRTTGRASTREARAAAPDAAARNPAPAPRTPAPGRRTPNPAPDLRTPGPTPDLRTPNAAPAPPTNAAPAPPTNAAPAPPTNPGPPAPAAPAPPMPPPPPSAPPRAIVYPLVSVIAADGDIDPEERALVDRFLRGEGLAPLADHEFCVHHPSSVAHLVPRERREEVVKLMCESAAVDGLPDESERRVIRAYAAAWHVDDEKLDFWMWGYESMNTSLARQLFLKLRRFVLSARWGDEPATP